MLEIKFSSTSDQTLNDAKEGDWLVFTDHANNQHLALVREYARVLIFPNAVPSTIGQIRQTSAKVRFASKVVITVLV